MTEATLVIATGHIRQKLFAANLQKEKGDLGKLITALQATGHHQSPYVSFSMLLGIVSPANELAMNFAPVMNL